MASGEFTRLAVVGKARKPFPYRMHEHYGEFGSLPCAFVTVLIVTFVLLELLGQVWSSPLSPLFGCLSMRFALVMSLFLLYHCAASSAAGGPRSLDTSHPSGIYGELGCVQLRVTCWCDPFPVSGRMIIGAATPSS